MLTQDAAQLLLELKKLLLECDDPLFFPRVNEEIRIDAQSECKKERFVFHVNRRNTYRPTKCTYVKRHIVHDVLLRLDVDGPPHRNPDGERIPCPHLHIYREGAEDRYAYPVPREFINLSDLEQTLQHFLRYSKVLNIPDVQRVLP